MKKEYTVSDWAYRHKKRRIEKEEKIIKLMRERRIKLKSTGYNLASKEKQKQLRAEAYTIPLEAFIKVEK